MDIRKVQKTGGSSYVVTLPKDWVTSQGVKEKDSVGMMTQQDGTLIITPRISEEKIQFTRTFHIKNSDSKFLFRCLIGSYMAGFTLIRITSDKKLAPFVRKSISRFIRMTVGQEVIEETDFEIILKDLLDPFEMPFDSTIKRMYTNVKSMCRDVITALKTQDLELASDVETRDNDVDRLHWLITRQYNLVLRDTTLARKLNVPTPLAAKYSKISKSLERIGDHAVKIAMNVKTLLTEEDVILNAFEKIEEANDLSIKLLSTSIDSFFKRNIQEANENIEAQRNLSQLTKSIRKEALTHEGVIAVSVDNIVESIQRIGEYSVDISESVIDYLIGEETESDV